MRYDIVTAKYTFLITDTLTGELIEIHKAHVTSFPGMSAAINRLLNGEDIDPVNFRRLNRLVTGAIPDDYKLNNQPVIS